MDFRKLLRVPVSQFVAFFSSRLRGKRASFTVRRTTITKGLNGKQNGVLLAERQEELNDVYDLGKTRLDLKMMVNDDTITSLQEQGYAMATYKEYQRLASKFNIHLQYPPIEEKLDREQKKQFFSEQIEKVESYINNQPNTVKYLYSVAIQVEKSRRILEMSISDNDHLTKHFKEIKEAAQKMGTDIDDELNHLENYSNFDTECINRMSRIKTKLCQVKPAPQRSELDRSRIITNEYWAISLVRLPDTFNFEHAFLVLEGKTDEKSMIWFADFVANDAVALFSPGIRDGRVRIDYHESKEMVGSPGELLYRCRKEMMEIAEDSSLVYSTWPISERTAQKLINNLEMQKNNPPKYNVAGNTALAAAPATLVGNPTGHNCFTFAKMMLHDLNTEYIQVPGDKVDEWIISAASRFLVDKQSPKERLRKYMLWFGLFVAGGGTASLFYNF